MILIITTSEQGSTFELRDGPRSAYLSRPLPRGRLLSALAARLSPRVRSQISRIMLSYEGGSFSEMRSAAAIGTTLGFALRLPVSGQAKARSGGRGALPAYAAPPHITAPAAIVGPISKGRPAARTRRSVQKIR